MGGDFLLAFLLCHLFCWKSWPFSFLKIIKQEHKTFWKCKHLFGSTWSKKCNSLICWLCTCKKGRFALSLALALVCGRICPWYCDCGLESRSAYTGGRGDGELQSSALALSNVDEKDLRVQHVSLLLQISMCYNYLI